MSVTNLTFRVGMVRQYIRHLLRKCIIYYLAIIYFFMFKELGEVNWLFNVTINDISVIYKTAHRFTGRLKKKLDLGRAPNAVDIS